MFCAVPVSLLILWWATQHTCVPHVTPVMWWTQVRVSSRRPGVLFVVHRKVDDLQFAVEETAIDKGDLEVMYFPQWLTWLLCLLNCYISHVWVLYVEVYYLFAFSCKSGLITVVVPVQWDAMRRWRISLIAVIYMNMIVLHLFHILCISSRLFMCPWLLPM